MLRRGDQDGVDALVVEQIAVIQVGLRVGRNLLGVFQPLGVDIGEGDKLGVGTGHGFAHILHAAVAGADDAEADAVVGSQNIDTANVPARPEATFPMKLRRDCMEVLLNRKLAPLILTIWSALRYN